MDYPLDYKNALLVIEGTTNVVCKAKRCPPQVWSLLHNFLQKRLQTFQFDYRFKRWRQDKAYYGLQGKRKKIAIPINFLGELIAYLNEHNIPYKRKMAKRYEARALTVKMNPAYVDKPHQTPAIDYLVNSKNTRVGLQLQTGCLTGDTVLSLMRNDECFEMSMELAYKKFNRLPSPGTPWDDGSPIFCRSCSRESLGLYGVYDIIYSGEQEVYTLRTSSGRTLTGTAHHPILTADGFKHLIDCINHYVVIDDVDVEAIGYEKVISVEPAGIQSTYDLSCPETSLFVANGIVSANSGKTYSATKAFVRLGKVGMIVVSGLVEQWQASISAQTDGADKIWIIKGFKSLADLFKSDIMPEIFICSLETLRQYITRKGNYAELPPYRTFIEYYGIGTKIVDEAHLNFHAGTLIDLAANVQKNIYLTATFETADRSLRRIFDTIFNKDVRYGADNYDKYVNVTFYGYMGNVPEKKVVSQRGYNHSKYEQHMLKHPVLFHDWMERVLLTILYLHYINKEYKDLKCLIFFRTLEMVSAVLDRLKDAFPNKSVVSYVADDEEAVLVDGDIILSTHLSAGTGVDIAKLAVVINTVSFKAPTTSKQVLGRIRKLKRDDIVPEYVDMVDLRLSSQLRHWRERSSILRDCALQYQEHKL